MTHPYNKILTQDGDFFYYVSGCSAIHVHSLMEILVTY